MIFLTLGIILDIIMVSGASSGFLPRMEESQGEPWASLLFIIYVVTSGFGMFSFFFIYVYLLIRGTNFEYKRLRNIQFKFFLPCWALGISIGLVNFFIKVLFEIRIYDII